VADHYSGDRKADAESWRSELNGLYKDKWGDDLKRILDLDAGGEYPDDGDKSIRDWHDIAGADVGLLIKTELGSMISFVEEKTRYFDPSGYADEPSGVDLALTIKYTDAYCAPKHRKHLELREQGMFVPTFLLFAVHDGDEICNAHLIDYARLLGIYDALKTESEVHHNDADNNLTRYIDTQTLEKHNLIEQSW
jgi:hypothetical protein